MILRASGRGIVAMKLASHVRSGHHTRNQLLGAENPSRGLPIPLCEVVTCERRSIVGARDPSLAEQD